MLENLDFEQDTYSRTSTGIYKNGQHSFRIMTCLAYNDRS